MSINGIGNDAWNMRLLRHLYACRAGMLGIYVREVACELAYCAMVTGRLDEAGQLLDDAALERYIATGRRFMSSKERLQCARELYLNNDRPAAEAIYQRLAEHRADYLLQGEVSSDLALMRAILY